MKLTLLHVNKRAARFLNGLILILFITFISSCTKCWLHKNWSGTYGHCDKIDTLSNNTKDALERFEHEYSESLLYHCAQIILDPSHPDYAINKSFLQNNCFELVDSCDCSPAYELWEYPDIYGYDVAPITLNPPSRGLGGHGNGMILNIEFNPPEPNTDKDNIINVKGINLNSISKLPMNCNFPNPMDTLRIAIVDSGIDSFMTKLDTSPASNNLRTFSWFPFNDGNKCNSNSNTRGIQMLGNPAFGEPNDTHGHGSSINSVFLGASSPNFIVVNNTLPLKVVNVGIMKPGTKKGNLFDALCGLNYSISQRPNIINISWGFRFLLTSKNIYLDSSIMRVFNSVFDSCKVHKILVVAAVGNSSFGQSKLLNRAQKFYPAWLASINNNVISVGASDSLSNNLANFSNFCVWDPNYMYMTVVAPGEDIINAYPKSLQNYVVQTPPQLHSGFVQQSGTSFATPYVGRLAAFIMALHPGISPMDVKSKIVNQFSKITNGNSTIINGQQNTLNFNFKLVVMDSVIQHMCN